MSEDVRNALRKSLDTTTVDFVDASISIVKTATSAEVSALQDDLSNIVARLEKIEADIAALPASNQAQYEDDKYALTKQKLVRLMVDMGYMK